MLRTHGACLGGLSHQEGATAELARRHICHADIQIYPPGAACFMSSWRVLHD
jgi:hypothetical protein